MLIATKEDLRPKTWYFTWTWAQKTEDLYLYNPATHTKMMEIDSTTSNISKTFWFWDQLSFKYKIQATNSFFFFQKQKKQN